MTQPMRYIISDSQDIPLAYAVLQSPASAEVWQMKVLDNGIDAVLDHDPLRLVGMNYATPAVSAKVVRSREDQLWIQPVQPLSDEARQNLRVAARFKTFVYPVTGKWKGRLTVVTQDLSCGGIGFFCDHPLEQGEIVEIVIPITFQPLLVQIKILRQRPSASKIPLWSAKFINMVDEQERLILESVFGQQILNRDEGLQPVDNS